MKAHTAETQEKITPKKALELLREGNQRFTNNNQISRDLLNQVHDTQNGQWPFAAVLSCIDSRTSSELVFDLGIGDIFSARVAGNVVNEDILGSIEYACKVAKSKLIVVMGHSKCGAVTSACKDVKAGNITALLSKIKPAISKVKSVNPDAASDDPAFVEEVAHQNVTDAMDQILEKSEILNEMYNNGEIGLVGAYYDVATGKVDFTEERFV